MSSMCILQKVKYELRVEEYVVAVHVSMDIPRRIECSRVHSSQGGCQDLGVILIVFVCDPCPKRLVICKGDDIVDAGDSLDSIPHCTAGVVPVSSQVSCRCCPDLVMMHFPRHFPV